MIQAACDGTTYCCCFKNKLSQSMSDVIRFESKSIDTTSILIPFLHCLRVPAILFFDMPWLNYIRFGCQSIHLFIYLSKAARLERPTQPRCMPLFRHIQNRYAPSSTDQHNVCPLQLFTSFVNWRLARMNACHCLFTVHCPRSIHNILYDARNTRD